MDKKYYYNLKLTKQEIDLLSIVLMNEFLKDKPFKYDVLIENMEFKIMDAYKKVEKIKKEDDKCQNHK